MKHSDSTDVLLHRYVELLLEKNRYLNLTSITDPEAANLLLLEDSLSGETFLSEAPAGPYADLGTGGGFPGIPLGIVSGRETWLVESRKKKLVAIREVLSTLQIEDQFTLCPMRIEEVAIQQPEYFAVVTARALTSLPSLLELAAPLLKQGGQLISYQASVDSEVLEHGNAVAFLVGMQLLTNYPLTLSDGVTPRTLLVYEKVSEPTIALPRRNGVAQKRPLA